MELWWVSGQTQSSGFLRVLCNGITAIHQSFTIYLSTTFLFLMIQLCEITVTNWEYNSLQQVIYTNQTDIGTGGYIENGQWKIADTQACTKIFPTKLGPRSQVVVFCYYYSASAYAFAQLDMVREGPHWPIALSMISDD